MKMSVEYFTEWLNSLTSSEFIQYKNRYNENEENFIDDYDDPEDMINEYIDSFKNLRKYGKKYYKTFKSEYREMCRDLYDYIDYCFDEAYKSCDFDY